MIQIATQVVIACDYCHRPYIPTSGSTIVHTFTPRHPDQPPVMPPDPQIRHHANRVLNQVIDPLRDTLAVIATGAVHANCRSMFGTPCAPELEHMTHATAAGS